VPLGQHAQPSLDAEQWRLNTDYLWGVDLYNLGFFWEAHEAWEAPWRAAAHESAQRRFLQGLIQCAAACLKARVGQPIASQRLSARALTRLRRVQAEQGDLYMGLHLAKFVPAFLEFSQLLTTAPVQPPPIHLALQG
jgi:predicted metal-dependent hydrolase